MKKRNLTALALISAALMLCTAVGGYAHSDARSSARSLSASTAASGQSTYIGQEAAQKAALDHAGLTASKVTFVKTKLERDDGRMVYDVEFYAGSAEYDYEIDATKGTILSYDYDAESELPAATTSPSGSTGSGTTGQITAEQAKTAALKHAGLTSSQVSFIKAKLDHDDGLTVYEVEFYAGGTEYEYDINAADGSVLEFDMEYDD